MPLRHEKMVLHKSRSETGTWKGGGRGGGRLASHYTGQTDRHMYEVRQSF